MILGLDYSAGRPGGKNIKDAGYTFAVRYLSEGGPGLPGKLLTPQEADDLRANGVGIAVVWETVAGRMLAGWQAGADDARRAETQIARCDGPTDRPVYFACDFDAAPGQQQPIDDYLRGAASVIGTERVGIYGGYWPLKRARESGVARWFWQTGAWSGSNRIDGHLYQRIGSVDVAGVACDVNEALADDYGQWDHPAQAPAPLEPAPTDRPDVYQLVWEQLMGPDGRGWPQLDGKSVVDFLAAFRSDFDAAINTLLRAAQERKA